MPGRWPPPPGARVAAPRRCAARPGLAGPMPSRSTPRGASWATSTSRGSPSRATSPSSVGSSVSHQVRPGCRSRRSRRPWRAPSSPGRSASLRCPRPGRSAAPERGAEEAGLPELEHVLAGPHGGDGRHRRRDSRDGRQQQEQQPAKRSSHVVPLLDEWEVGEGTRIWWGGPPSGSRTATMACPRGVRYERSSGSPSSPSSPRRWCRKWFGRPGTSGRAGRARPRRSANRLGQGLDVRGDGENALGPPRRGALGPVICRGSQVRPDTIAPELACSARRLPPDASAQSRRDLPSSRLVAISTTVSPGQSQNLPVEVEARRTERTSWTKAPSRSPNRWGAAKDVDR